MQGTFTNGFGFPWISSIRLARVHSHGVTRYPSHDEPSWQVILYPMLTTNARDLWIFSTTPALDIYILLADIPTGIRNIQIKKDYSRTTANRSQKNDTTRLCHVKNCQSLEIFLPVTLIIFAFPTQISMFIYGIALADQKVRRKARRYRKCKIKHGFIHFKQAG